MATSTLKMGGDAAAQKDFLEVLKLQIEANLASHESKPGPLAMSRQDEFNFGQFNSQKALYTLAFRVENE